MPLESDNPGAPRDAVSAPDPNLRWNAMRMPVQYRGLTINERVLQPEVYRAVCDFIAGFPVRWVPEDVALQDYPRDRSLIGRGLTVMGVPRTGKTRLGCAILTEIALGYRDATALFCPFADYVHAFNERHAWRGQSDSAAGLNLAGLDVALNAVMSASLLLLDDIGREHMTASSSAADELYRILRSRQRRGLVTLVTTSLTTPSLLTAYDAHLADLLLSAFDTVVLEPTARF